MQQLDTNAYFWHKLDTILWSCSCTFFRPKGSTHYKFTNLVYPVDYGFLSDTFGSDQKPIDVFKGSIATNNVDAIAITADILKKDCIVKLLIGCTEEETMRILEFLDQTEFQKAILVRRGNDTPSWSNND